jgi:hypothetical protein
MKLAAVCVPPPAQMRDTVPSRLVQPPQTWRTLLSNDVGQIVAADLFVESTV